MSRLAIGVDADQADEAPGRVLTSMVKGVDAVVFDQIARVRGGTFRGGIFEYGLAEGGVGYVYDARNRPLIPDSRAHAARSAQGGDHRRHDRGAEHAMTAPLAIELAGIDKRFGAVRANRGATLEVAPGGDPRSGGRERRREVDADARSSPGCSPPTPGRREWTAAIVTGWRTADAIAAGVGMVHQHFMLVPTLTVAENVVLGREPTPRARRSISRARTPR